MCLKPIDAFGVGLGKQVKCDVEFTSEDVQLSSLWKSIVALSKNPKTTFRFVEHFKSDATGLFHLIDFCNIDRETFIRSYLFQLQPFMVHLDTAYSDKRDGFACIIDSSYGTPLWIEVIYKQFGEALVSFRELNYHVPAPETLGNSRKKPLLCVHNGSHGTGIGTTGYFEISVLKGFLSFELPVYGKLVTSDLIKIDYPVYEAKLLEKCNVNLELILRQLNVSAMAFPMFHKGKPLSFTSLGESLVTDLSMLLDLFLATKSAEVSAVLAVKAQQLVDLPNGRLLTEELLHKVKRYHGELDLSWLFSKGMNGGSCV